VLSISISVIRSFPISLCFCDDIPAGKKRARADADAKGRSAAGYAVGVLFHDNNQRPQAILICLQGADISLVLQENYCYGRKKACK
jgi:hypothetical protein